MSVMNILSDETPSVPAPSAHPPSPERARKATKVASPVSHVKAEIAPAIPVQGVPQSNGAQPVQPPAAAASLPLPPPTGPPGLTVKAVEEAYAEIEKGDLSDIEAPGFEMPEQEWHSRSKKRALEVQVKEGTRRKVCNTHVDTLF